jgi:hypothetical protein
MALMLTLTTAATDYDLRSPFGFCTRSSRTSASSTYNITGGGCYTYPIADGFTGKVITLKSTGKDMKNTIANAIKQNAVVIFDGSAGDFIVSSTISISAANKTLLGINGARLCTQWYVTSDIKQALDAAGVRYQSLSNGWGSERSDLLYGLQFELPDCRTLLKMLTTDDGESIFMDGCNITGSFRKGESE